MLDELNPWLPPLIGVGAGVLAVAALTWLVIRTRRRNHAVREDPTIWDGRDYRCPSCGAAMEQGWVLMGKGAIWAERDRGRPGAFSLVTQALPNTLSFRPRPAANMAWRCAECQVLLIDYTKLVY